MVSGALIKLISLCAFSAVCEQILSGGRLLSSVRFLSGILLTGVLVELLAAVLNAVSF